MKKTHWSIKEFTRKVGIGRTKTYSLIAAGEIDTVKIGRRTLICRKSAKRLLERSLTSRDA